MQKFLSIIAIITLFFGISECSNSNNRALITYPKVEILELSDALVMCLKCNGRPVPLFICSKGLNKPTKPPKDMSMAYKHDSQFALDAAITWLQLNKSIRRRNYLHR